MSDRARPDHCHAWAADAAPLYRCVSCGAYGQRALRDGHRRRRGAIYETSGRETAAAVLPACVVKERATVADYNLKHRMYQPYERQTTAGLDEELAAPLRGAGT